MKRSRTLKQIALAGLLALSSVVSGSGTEAVAQTPVIPQMTIVLYNNSAGFNIYPVMSFPGQTPDEWLQGFFGVTTAEKDTKEYPSAGTTRVYVNCCAAGQNGIPPGGSVTIKLPLYTPLVSSIDPIKPGQLIEWWQGGNINLYSAPVGVGKPPTALKTLWDDPNRRQKRVDFSGGSGPRPRCPDTTPCQLSFFKSSTPDPLDNPAPNSPQQLVEFTLGAAPANPRAKPGNSEPYFFFDPQNVDYDVSYVNSAYLPVVMEPFGNNLMGWVGAPSSIAKFNTSVTNFLNSDLAKGWPRYIGSDGNVVPGKVPSALEIFFAGVRNDATLADDGQWVIPSLFSPAPPNSPPIKRMINAWKNCQQKGNINQFCVAINEATKLVRANFDNYVANYSNNLEGWNCKTTKFPNPHPLDKAHLTDLQVLQHLYGWTPFNEHCGARANLLQKTPGYDDPKKAQNFQRVKNVFDQLQYWRDVLEGDYGVFHPYVSLIHGPTFINAPYTYAYSVDDAVGNVQTDGTGLIIAVGGLNGLPNPDHATPDVHFNFAYESLSTGHTFDFYGRCSRNPTTPTNPNFASFPVPVGVTKKVSDCPISFKDNLGRTYQLQISDQYPPNTWMWFYPEISGDAKARLPVQDSCIRNTDTNIRNWCNRIFAFRKQLDDARQTVEYHVQIQEAIP